VYILYTHCFRQEFFVLTRIFKSGNSLAVRIPKELAIAGAAEEVEIERVGNTLVLRPVRQRSLAGVGEIFAMFSPDFMSEGREFHEERERDWSASGTSGGGV
jgi:antitoxin VapB